MPATVNRRLSIQGKNKKLWKKLAFLHRRQKREKKNLIGKKGLFGVGSALRNAKC
jgi:hypothetical protein